MIRQCMSLRHPVYKEIPRSRIFGLFVSRALGRVDELAAGPHGLQIQRASSVVASQQNVGLLPLLERANARAAHTWPHKYLGSHRLLSTHRRSDRSNDNWELTVGIEVHAQLNTDLKLFSSATTAFVGQPNEHVSVFDAAIPGSQPVFQQATLIPALRAALALNCEIARESRFDRKHYFYQDQPAGYQITQYYKPFARGGFLTLTRDDGIDPSDGDEVTVGIKQVQLEQDTAKTTQEGSSTYLLDFNRVSHPLIEIISLPDIHHPATAAAFVRKIQSTLSSMNAAIIGMEFGGLRADVNVSIRRKASHDAFRSDLPETGRVGLGQRTEIKNLSSFKAIEDAIRAERNRQIDIIEAGGVIKGETRGWTLGSTETERLRGKEGEVDYRYMPDPDLPPLRICESLITGLKSNMPTSVENIVAALTTSKQYGLSKRDAKTLAASENAARLNYYVQVVNELTELAVEAGHTKPIDPYFGSGRIVGNWVIHELGGLMNNSNLHWDPEMSVPSSAMAELINLVLGKDITGQTAKKLLTIIFCGDRRAPKKIVEDENLWFHPLSEEDYKNLAKTVIRNNQGIVKAILRKGETGRVKFLVGQVMHFGEKGRVEAPKAEAAIRQMINALL